MKHLATAALTALAAAPAAAPAFAHADGAAHLHGTDAAVWLVIALCTGLAAAHLLRR